MISELLKKRSMKLRLINAFRSADLYMVHKNVYSYPAINSVRFLDNKTEIVFTLPVGIDPKRVENSFIFTQLFGDNIDLVQKNRKFVLNIYKHHLPQSFQYNYSKILPHIKDIKLPIVAGNSRHGIESYDMVDHPHLLIAGETGSGKSTQLRSIISTLIMSKKPDELELYMADLKRSEFHLFRLIKHVRKVATKTNELLTMLLNIKKELEYRGDLLDAWELTHIDDYNAIADVKKPYIIVCIDEVALLKKERKIMSIIEDISAIGRALGVFLILSMQRPDADVLDGKLKNNLTVRMAFRHSDGINSRITIGTSDAADINISDRGRMWFKMEDLKMVQAPFLSVAGAKKLLEPFRNRRSDFRDMGEASQTHTGQIKVLGVLDDEET